MANVGQLLSNAFLTAYQAETARRQKERELADANRQFTELMDYRNRALASDIGYKEADIDYRNRKLASDIDYQTKKFEAETDYQSGMLAENRLERERRTDVDQANFASKYIEVPQGTAGSVGGDLLRTRAGKIAGDLDPNAYYIPLSLSDKNPPNGSAGVDVSENYGKLRGIGERIEFLRENWNKGSDSEFQNVYSKEWQKAVEYSDSMLEKAGLQSHADVLWSYQKGGKTFTESIENLNNELVRNGDAPLSQQDIRYLREYFNLRSPKFMGK